jgi:glycosyltransferase involved in cell wall biosynthesis
MSDPKRQIQVYIPVYNDIRFLPDAVASVLAQRDVDVEVVVSDNASTDGTSEWLAQAASTEPRIVMHRNPQNLGLMANLNRFRALITSDYYMLLCSDDRLGSPDSLSSALQVMKQCPDVVSVYADMLYIDGLGRGITARSFGRSGRFDAAAVLRGSIISGRNLFGIPLLHRRSAGMEIAYPDAMTYVADVYHSARCADHGTLFHLPRKLIHNRFSGANATGQLYRTTLRQFDLLAEDFGIKLSAAERMLQRIQTNKTVLAKAAFLRYVGWRSRSASKISQAPVTWHNRAAADLADEQRSA